MKLLAIVTISIVALVSGASALSGTAAYGDITATITDANGNTATSHSTVYDATYTGWQQQATLDANLDATASNTGSIDTTTFAEADVTGLGSDGDLAYTDIYVWDVDGDATGGFTTTQGTTATMGAVVAGQITTGYIDDGQIDAFTVANEGLGNYASQYAWAQDYDTADADWGFIDTETFASANIASPGLVIAAQLTYLDTDAFSGGVVGYSASDAFSPGCNSYADMIVYDDGDGAQLWTDGFAVADDFGSYSDQIWTAVNDDTGDSLSIANVGPIQASMYGAWGNFNLAGWTGASQDLITPIAWIA